MYDLPATGPMAEQVRMALQDSELFRSAAAPPPTAAPRGSFHSATPQGRHPATRKAAAPPCNAATPPHCIRQLRQPASPPARQPASPPARQPASPPARQPASSETVQRPGGALADRHEADFPAFAWRRARDTAAERGLSEAVYLWKPTSVHVGV